MLNEIERQLVTLSDARTSPAAAWRRCGEVAVVEDDDAAIALSDEYAPEHLEVQTRRDGYYLSHLRNYGSLFLGEESTVAYGDKGVGTNHTLPTGRAARYTGGLWVGKFLKTVTYQRLTQEASERIAPIIGRMCAHGGHAGPRDHRRCSGAALRAKSSGEQRLIQKSREEDMTIRRREVLTGTAATGLLGPLAGRSFAEASKSGTVRVWGEPGPYGGVAVAAMNEWAQKNAPALKFEIEIIPWDGVYVKLMTDLAARRPPALISVELPLAMQLMAEELLVPLDDVADKVGRDRLVPGVKWDFWGAWKGKQYVIPAHHQPHLLLVRTDITRELGLSDPDTWTWADLANAARTISQKKPDMAGICLALGRNLCTDYHFAALLHRPAGACSRRRTSSRWRSTARRPPRRWSSFASCTSSCRRARSNTASFRWSTRTSPGARP